MSDTRQDDEVPQIPGHLGRLLVLGRVLAGHRGWANITWHGQGFTYTLAAVRDPRGNPALVDFAEDPNPEGLGAEDHGPIRAEITELLTGTP